MNIKMPIECVDLKAKAKAETQDEAITLYGNLDLSDEQRDQVGSIMREQMEKGKNQREGFKSETRDRLAAVLTDEQLRGFEENSMRMERRKEHMKDMDRKKGKDGRKGYKKKKRGKHKPRPQHN